MLVGRKSSLKTCPSIPAKVFNWIASTHLKVDPLCKKGLNAFINGGRYEKVTDMPAYRSHACRNG
jgi:hypothetical protein